MLRFAIRLRTLIVRWQRKHESTVAAGYNWEYIQWYIFWRRAQPDEQYAKRARRPWGFASKRKLWVVQHWVSALPYTLWFGLTFALLTDSEAQIGKRYDGFHYVIWTLAFLDFHLPRLPHKVSYDDATLFQSCAPSDGSTTPESQNSCWREQLKPQNIFEIAVAYVPSPSHVRL